ncbi:TetR/AcrR family transcriptional regulator [Streptomyces sp. NPDC004647]|uniref:TetR/AcrR family transcriptional regulator n=1 Tax=Streptomyces sp. NPDC004647 TaxID=3154671 RepID=UPI0033B6D50A
MRTGVRRRMGVEERREQLIAVAQELFSQRPPGEVSIDEIATAAGISRPLVYHYFPGKNSLYDEVVQRAADELTRRFSEPQEGPLGARLLRVMGRYFDFVDQHGPGFSALLRGGTSVGPERANALIDEVRQAAYNHMLAHLGVTAPGPRIALAVRSWIGVAETTALMWLDGREMPRDQLELQLVHDFMALVAVSAAYDEEAAALVRWIVAQEPVNGTFGDLVSRLITLAPAPAEAVAVAVAETSQQPRCAQPS